MKRAISIFLLFIMMLIAIHPVVAMHYCGGELHSLNLYQPDHESSCCMMADFDDAPNLQMVMHQSNCCEFDSIEISTDDFQHQANTIDLIPLLSSIANSWFTINNLFALNQPEKNTDNFLNEFPPKGLFMEDVSILTYICIYRI